MGKYDSAVVFAHETRRPIVITSFIARLCALVPPPRAHTVLYCGVLSAHHALRCAVVPCSDEPEPEPKQLSLFITRGQLKLLDCRQPACSSCR